MSAYSDLVLAHADLVGYWRLGDTSGDAIDAFGSNDGTCTDITYGVSGALTGDADTAFTFNGASSRVNVGNTEEFKFFTGSIEAWFKRSGATFQQAIVGKSGAYNMFISQDDFAVHDFDAGVFRSSNISVIDGLWHHAVVTVVSGGSNQTLLYLDGELVHTATSATQHHNLDVIIGDFTAGGTNPFGGQIDEVALYDAILTPTVIAEHYTLGVEGPPSGSKIIMPLSARRRRR
jgi:hypothetical protein